MYNLTIRKCTSPPHLAPRLKIFAWLQQKISCKITERVKQLNFHTANRSLNKHGPHSESLAWCQTHGGSRREANLHDRISQTHCIIVFKTWQKEIQRESPEKQAGVPRPLATVGGKRRVPVINVAKHQARPAVVSTYVLFSKLHVRREKVAYVIY